MAEAIQSFPGPAPAGGSFTRLESIRAGDEAYLTKTVTGAEIDAFAALSGDYNPLHMDHAFAERAKFPGRVTHGMLTASYVSTLIGMQIPGPGALWTQQLFRWPAPVFVGDTIDIRMKVTHVSAGARIVSLTVEARNQNGSIVMTGEGNVMLLEPQQAGND